MGNNELIATVVLVVLWLLAVIGLIVDDLAGWDENESDNYLIYGATESRYDYKDFGTSGDSSYADSCDDGSDDACDIEGQGMGYLICTIIGVVTGLVCVIYGAAFSNDKLGLLCKAKCPLEKLGPLKVPSVLSIVTGLLFLIGAIIWAIDNPVFDVDGFDAVLGVSWYLVLVAGIGFLVFAAAFEKVYSTNPVG